MINYIESIVEGLFPVLIFLFLISIPLTIGYFSGTKTCPAKWPNRETQFGFWSGCQVKVNGEFVPEDSIKIIELQK